MVDSQEWSDAKGNIYFPGNFRSTLVHLGSWYVPEGGAAGFHNVYTQPSALEAYQATGKFPDGAVLVKELRSAKSGNYSTGDNVKSATNTILQTFVMVKDSKNSHKGNASWGDGWGWALFKPGNPGVNLSKDYKADCLGCHVPAKGNDWIYIDGYPR